MFTNEELQYISRHFSWNWRTGMDDYLKACPFCGHTEPYVERLRWFWQVFYNVICICGISQFEQYKTKAEAIEAWNRRVNG